MLGVGVYDLMINSKQQNSGIGTTNSASVFPTDWVKSD